jgi:hypothetical protein
MESYAGNFVFVSFRRGRLDGLFHFFFAIELNLIQ